MLKILKNLKCSIVVLPVFKRYLLQAIEPIDTGTMTEVTTKLMSQLGVDIGYQAEQKKRDHLLKYMPKREDLPPRSMGESYIMATIPLRTDKAMQEKYVSNVGTVRLGRLIEAMDFFAIWVCQQYIKIPNLPPNERLPYIFVNIIVNSMSILGQLPSYDKDLRISGYVSSVGKTSLEVSVWVHLINGKVMSQITHGNFLMAARNATNTGSAPVNPLKIETEEEKQISEEAKKLTVKFLNRYGVEIGYQPNLPKRDHLLKYTTKQDQLPVRCMKDSYILAIIPLSTEPSMQVIYINSVGQLRIGRLLEAMDIFAGYICQQYVHLPDLPANETLPYTFVTMMVDGTRVESQLPAHGRNVHLTGHTSWVGKTSLEVSVWANIVNDEALFPVTQLNFLMVARNATNTGPAEVNAIKTCNDEEEKIIDEGALRAQRRRERQKTPALRTKPTPQEHEMIYDLVDKTTDKLCLELNKRTLPDGGRWMSDSFAMSTVVSFPENRNAQNTVFGGFIMRNCVEISFAAAYQYCLERPILEHISEISFDKPVPIRSILKMFSYIIYVEENFMIVMTVNEIIEANTGENITTNEKIASTIIASIPVKINPAL
uniref:HotDog ACOT-type domain-containing protein n=1 Tax=Glossina austeni TaxID=7395 RepID=A0A1A9VMC2_GLOAU